MQAHIALLRKSLTELYDSRETNSIISLLMEEVCGISRVDMIMNPARIIASEQAETLERFASLLQQGIPVQQVLGYEYFLSQKFQVNPDVLIPRPETAELVEWIVSDVQKSGIETPKILDVGTGSGCIAISLASLINNSQTWGIDLSTGALKTAKQNAESLKISNVSFVQKDIIAEQDKSFEQSGVDNFDVIVSNPPYIMDKEKSEMSANVLDHEPHLALFVPDDDPLLFYRAIARYGKINLKPGGNLYFEINAALGKETAQLLEEMGYKDVVLRKDINDRDRMIKATI